MVSQLTKQKELSKQEAHRVRYPIPPATMEEISRRRDDLQALVSNVNGQLNSFISGVASAIGVPQNGEFAIDYAEKCFKKQPKPDVSTKPRASDPATADAPSEADLVEEIEPSLGLEEVGAMALAEQGTGV